MRTAFMLLLMVALMPGCGLYMQIQEEKRQEAARAKRVGMAAEMRVIGEELKAEWAQGRYRNHVEVFREFASRSRALYQRYDEPMSPVDSLFFSYGIALAARVDRGEISSEEAQYLLDKMVLDVEAERQRLTLQQQLVQAQREMAAAQNQLYWQRWWDGYWARWQQMYQPRLRTPIRCNGMNLGGGFYTVDCY